MSRRQDQPYRLLPGISTISIERAGHWLTAWPQGGQVTADTLCGTYDGQYFARTPDLADTYEQNSEHTARSPGRSATNDVQQSLPRSCLETRATMSVRLGMQEQARKTG